METSNDKPSNHIRKIHELCMTEMVLFINTNKSLILNNIQKIVLI